MTGLPAPHPHSIIAATLLDQAGINYRLHHHPPVLTAADHANSGLDLAHSAKTLAFLIGGQPVLVTLPATARLGYGQFARAVKTPRSHIKSAPTEVLERLGMEPGGV